MMMTKKQLLKLAFFISFSFIYLSFSSISVDALKVGAQQAYSPSSVAYECSSRCESEFCTVPPLLRYGKYCGLLYSGCHRETPCDGLDVCCMKHDACIEAMKNEYLSQECSQNFLECVENFRREGAHTFTGNTCQIDDVIDVITVVMEAALVAGNVLHKP